MLCISYDIRMIERRHCEIIVCNVFGGSFSQVVWWQHAVVSVEFHLALNTH